MPLRSELLRDDPRLASCLVRDDSHLVEGTVGACVGKVQIALFIIDGLKIHSDELQAKRYGRSTADAVLSFKARRNIINRGYQSKPDNIVGKMTVAALDEELLKKQKYAQCRQFYCGSGADRGTERRVTSTAALAFTPQQVRAPTAASGSSPAQVAITRAPRGVMAVARARAVLAQLTGFHRTPSLPIPPFILQEFDALWSYFGMPKFPLFNPLGGEVNDLDTYFSVVDRVLGGMANFLQQAGTWFRDPPASLYPEAYAFTLSRARHSKEPPASPQWPDGIYFNSGYLSHNGNKIGPLKQTEIAIHECAHLVQNDNIQDPAEHTLSSAYGYSGYVLHCAFGRSTPFNENE